MRRHIPNALTLLNLLCGCIAVICAVNGNFILTAFFTFLGIFFDFFDGFFARKFNVQGELGLQLDSLADMVTSGLVPGIVMFQLFLLSSGCYEVNITVWSWDSLKTIPQGAFTYPLAFLGLLITLSSAYRLAKFNIDTEQQDSFKGLPTPANALLIISLPLIMEFQGNDIINAIILNKWFLIAVTLLSSYILNSKIKLFALKFKTWSFKDNATRYVFLVLCLVTLIVLQVAAIPLIIVIYVIMSLLDTATSKK